MKESPGTEVQITKLLHLLAHAPHSDRKTIIGELVVLLRDELRERASGVMRGERLNHPLQTTALYHETFLKLVNSKLTFEDRRHFLVMSGKMMRQVVIDIARRQSAKKRGDRNKLTALDYDTAESAVAQDPESLLDLDRAISQLDPEDQELVEQTFFCGLTMEEAADAMQVKYETLRKRWSGVRRDLFRTLTGK